MQHLPNQATSIFSAVLATLGENLNHVPGLAQIDMNLTIFAIHLGLNTHRPVPHVDTMLDTTAFKPLLPPNFDTQLRLDGSQHPMPAKWRPSRCGKHISLGKPNTPNRRRKIIPNLENIGQHGITASV